MEKWVKPKVDQHQVKRLQKLEDFNNLLKWIEYKAQSYKDLGFEELDEQKRLIYLGRNKALTDLLREIDYLSKKPSTGLDKDLEI